MNANNEKDNIRTTAKEEKTMKAKKKVTAYPKVKCYHDCGLVLFGTKTKAARRLDDVAEELEMIEDKFYNHEFNSLDQAFCAYACRTPKIIDADWFGWLGQPKKYGGRSIVFLANNTLATYLHMTAEVSDMSVWSEMNPLRQRLLSGRAVVLSCTKDTDTIITWSESHPWLFLAYGTGNVLQSLKDFLEADGDNSFNSYRWKLKTRPLSDTYDRCGPAYADEMRSFGDIWYGRSSS